MPKPERFPIETIFVPTKQKKALKLVGWVERNETHQQQARHDGFASVQPIQSATSYSLADLSPY